MPWAMWFPLGRRGEFGADITVFRRSPGWAIWLLLADLNVDDSLLSGGEGFVRILLNLQGPRTESHSLHM